ncbi:MULTISPECIES: hypothetical protein [unclassified Streptomyces]|uniref:hypothetical protein n=1 Tax=unclassified Streptomyces TaxID=2593676 RepID=UPI0033FE476D
MGAFSNFARSLMPGNDRDLAKDRYAGREFATDRAARKRRQNHHRSAAKADRRGQAWEDRDRRRFR